MKKILLLVTVFFGFVGVLFAQATNDPPAGGTGPVDSATLWNYVVAIVSPIIIWGVNKIVPKIPKLLLPLASPFVGLAVGLLLNKIADAGLSAQASMVFGGLAVFLREVTNQALKAAGAISSESKPSTPGT